MKKFLEEFKAFALKGNVMDMAIGVIIGGAFSAIITALTESFINPLINSIGGAEVAGSIKLPWVDYSGLDSEAAAALSLNYGAFITAVINFVIIAFVLFLMLKGMNKLMNLRKKEEEAAPDPEPSKEEVLLTEIRDLLKEKK
ncbi:MAG: large conductance mechanosensitive channel protein MscL [Eubacterium sp.]|nr:large conductance mechanosensitive channel protein MscL [Eubacterium sp.]